MRNQPARLSLGALALALALAAATTIAATPALGQQGQGCGRGQGAGTGMRCAGGGPGQGPGQGQGGATCGGNGPDVSRAAAIEGTVKSFTGGPGQGRPTLVLVTSQGERSFLLSPYRVLRASGYTPAAGSNLTLKAAPVSVNGTEEWVALNVTDLASARSIDLRDPATGLPNGGRGCSR